MVCSSLFLLKSIFVLSSSGVNNFNEKEKIARWSLSSGIYRLRWLLETQKTGEQSSECPGEIVPNPLKREFSKKKKSVIILQVGWPGAAPSERVGAVVVQASHGWVVPGCLGAVAAEPQAGGRLQPCPLAMGDAAGARPFSCSPLNWGGESGVRRLNPPHFVFSKL